jgi:hypothetical protein
VGSPRVAVSRPLIIRELHIDLVSEFDVASGDLVVYLLQFLEKPAIGGGLGDFCFNGRLLSPQTLESQLVIGRLTMVLAGSLSLLKWRNSLKACRRSKGR